MRVRATLFSFLFVFTLSAGEWDWYPYTMWTLRNLSDTNVQIDCISDPVLGRNQRISLRETVTAHATVVHNWGPEWSNGSLGLNPGIWTCSVRSLGERHAQSLRFKTDWGENITLQIRRDLRGLFFVAAAPVE